MVVCPILSPVRQKRQPHIMPTSWQNANHLAAGHFVPIALLAAHPLSSEHEVSPMVIVPR
jgi:hypothetical protein